MTEILETQPVTELEKVISESGLQLSESEEIKTSYLPFISQLDEIKQASAKIDFQKPTEIDETISRELRLKTVKIRTGAEALKDSRKKIHLLKGNLEQASFNIIKASCQLIEETFTQVEKAREIAETKRKAALKIERAALLLPFEVNGEFFDLANMPDVFFNNLLENSKLAFEKKQADALKVEQDRIAKELAEAAEKERMRLENEKLKAEAEAKEIELEAERAKALKASIAAAEKALKEREAIEEKARNERLASEAESKRLLAIQEEKAKKEREERKRLEDQLQAKEAAEAKAKLEAEQLAEAELSKGDAAKFEDLIKDLETLCSKYSFKSKKHKAAYASIQELITKTISYAISKQ